MKTKGILHARNFAFLLEKAGLSTHKHKTLCSQKDGFTVSMFVDPGTEKYSWEICASCREILQKVNEQAEA